MQLMLVFITLNCPVIVIVSQSTLVYLVFIVQFASGVNIHDLYMGEKILIFSISLSAYGFLLRFQTFP